ncbi:MAG: hypothetical protein OHK0013_02210 [Sandaracinaceae bacterium]
MSRASWLAAGLVTVGCGAASASVPTANPPAAGRVQREMVRSRRGSSDTVRIEAIVDEAGVRLLRADHAQGGQTVRSLPPEAEARLSQRVDPESGAVVVALGQDLAFALGAELSTALSLAPFGATGLARDGEGETQLALGVPADSVIPRIVPVRCVHARAEVLRCEGRLDRVLALGAGAEEVRASLEGTVSLEVAFSGAIPMRCELELRFDVVTRFGEVEEHDPNEVRLRTNLAP